MTTNQLEAYLENTKVVPSVLSNKLTHPITGKTYPNRFFYLVLKKYASDFFKNGAEPRMIGMAGLRGVGKTTLLWQLANYVYNNATTNIYFFNVNILRTLDISLFDALEGFQTQILKKRFNQLKEPIVLLFDEIHDDPEWSKTLKILYDEAKTAFIINTGSSALLLQQTADLARRMHMEKIYPYKFTEFIIAKTYFADAKILPPNGIAQNIKEALYFSENAEECIYRLNAEKNIIDNYTSSLNDFTKNKTKDLIQEYISYHNIPSYLFYQNKSAIQQSIVDLFKRVILEDIPKISKEFSGSNNIERLLFRLAASDEVNVDKLTQDIGVKKREIEEMLSILDKAELINILAPYGGINTRINKNKKAFFMSPSLRRALLSVIYGNNLPEEFRSKMMEDLIVLYIRRILPDSMVSYMSEKGQVNPDFIIETRDKPIIIEAGLGKSTDRQVTKSNIDYRYGIIISSNISDPVLKGNSIFLPFNWFLML